MTWLLIVYAVGAVVTALIVWYTAREPSAGEVAVTLFLWPLVLPIVGVLWLVETFYGPEK